MLNSVAKTYPRKQFPTSRLDLTGREAGHSTRKTHVFQGIQLR